MSFVPQIPNPFSTYTAPFASLSIPDRRFDLWSYRLLRSLQRNTTLGPFIHQPYYRPFTTLWEGFIRPPFLNGGEHYFEWRSTSHFYPICIILFSINPLYHFPSTRVEFNTHRIFGCPVIHILWWDLPRYLPEVVSTFFADFKKDHDIDFDPLCASLDAFIDGYYAPITPHLSSEEEDSPSARSSPSYSPLDNPNSIPLVRQ